MIGGHFLRKLVRVLINSTVDPGKMDCHGIILFTYRSRNANETPSEFYTAHTHTYTPFLHVQIKTRIRNIFAQIHEQNEKLEHTVCVYTYTCKREKIGNLRVKLRFFFLNLFLARWLRYDKWKFHTSGERVSLINYG